jgi:hypothetical protein
MSLEINPRTPVVVRTVSAELLPAVMRKLVAESHSFYAEPEPNGEWSIYFNKTEASILDNAIVGAAELVEREQYVATFLEMVASGNTEPDRLQEIAHEILHPAEPSNYE